MGKVLHFSNEDINNIIKLHNEGLFDREIAEKYNVSRSSISKLLRENGIENRHPKLTQERKDLAYELYMLYRNVDKVANIAKMSTSTVTATLREHGLTYYDMVESIRKYDIDKRYFDVIDNCRKAYFLGLIYADGCITDSGFVISLQEADKDILENYKKN